MTKNFLDLFTQAGGFAKSNVGTTAAKSARVAGLMQDGYRLWFDGLTASVSDAGRLAAEFGKVRSPADLAALHRDWLSTTQTRVTEGVQSFLDVSAKIAAEVSVVPLPVTPVAPVAPAPLTLVPKSAPIPEPAPVVAPVVEAAAPEAPAAVVEPTPEPAPNPVIDAVVEALVETAAPEAPAAVTESVVVEAPVEAAIEAPVETPVAAPVAEAAPVAAPPVAAPAVKPSMKAALRRGGAKTPTTKSAAKAASTFE